MARTRSLKIRVIKDKLVTRIRSGYYSPGDRFFSNRGIARHFEVSYQTAHRLLCELEEEGWLMRRPFSGSYISGRGRSFSSVTLCFNARARRPASFGEHVVELLAHRLDRERVDWGVQWADRRTPAADSIPVIWECPHTLAMSAESRHFSVLVNEQAPAGIARSFIDSVAVDDFSGGVSAAELIAAHTGSYERICVLAGPAHDERNLRRIEGFRSVLPGAAVYSAGTWEFDDGYRAADHLLASRPRAVFCCNDRLASALIRRARDDKETPPAIVGFDNAPVSEKLNLTTVAIPWDQLVDRIVAVLKQRLAGDKTNSIQYTLNPLPIVRDSFFR